MTERTATRHEAPSTESYGAPRSDISRAVELISSSAHLPGRAAYRLLAGAATEHAMSVSEMATIILRVPGSI